jgi:hypothetical protein
MTVGFQQLLLAQIEKLKHDPDKHGKALSEDLIGYPSIRAVGLNKTYAGWV